MEKKIRKIFTIKYNSVLRIHHLEKLRKKDPKLFTRTLGRVAISGEYEVLFDELLNLSSITSNYKNLKRNSDTQYQKFKEELRGACFKHLSDDDTKFSEEMEEIFDKYNLVEL